MKKKQIDPDTPLTEEEMHSAQWMRGIHELPVHAQAAIRRMGRPPLAHPKKKVTVRLDDDVLATLRAGGKGWQTRMNAWLREAIHSGQL